MTNTLSIAVLQALEQIPSLRHCDPKKRIHFPCNSEYDFNLLVDMCDYRLEDEKKKYEKKSFNNEATYHFPNGGVIHIFVKEG